MGREAPEMPETVKLSVEVSSYLNGFAENLRLRGKLPATVESYVRDAQIFIAFAARHNLRLRDAEPETLIAFQEFLRHDLGERDNSVRRTIIGVRQFFRYLMTDQKFGETPFDIVPIPQRDESLPKALEQHHIDLLMVEAARSKPAIKAARDVAMIMLLAYEGLKANELIQLRWMDLIDDGAIMTLAIPGTRPRVITLSLRSREALVLYRNLHATLSKKNIIQAADKRVFIAFKGRDSNTPLPNMTRHGLKFVLYELGEKLNRPFLNTELLRHHAVTHLITLGRAPEEIMHHLGLRRLGNIAKHLSKQNAPRSPAATKALKGSVTP